jgi:two-component system LytT family response regulator
MIRALIADDEAPARAKLRKLLGGESDFVIAAEASDGEEAVKAIRDDAPDVVFLDIQMPRLDGFGVIDAVGVESMPLVVFVTAFDEHALRAFEVHAFDYLLKPIAPQRFRGLIERVRRQLAAGESGALANRLQQLLESAAPKRFLQRILVRAGDEREVLLPLDSVDIIRADRNNVCFVTRGGEFVRRTTIGDLESRLDPDRFLRINRSEIVRLDAVRELQPWFHGDARIILRDGTTLTWSRRYRSRSIDL